jgi:hemolysin activation/secretion protein
MNITMRITSYDESQRLKLARMPRRQRIAITAAVATLTASLQVAAQATDPGRVYDSVQPRQAPSLLPSAPALNIQRTPNAFSFSEAGAQLQVSAFRLVGVKQLTDEALQQKLAPLLNRSLTVAQINSAAELVTQAYREAGFALAQAVVLPQSVEGGVIAITVNEGNLQKLEFTSPAQTSVPPVLQTGLSQAVRADEAVNIKQLEEALLLGNDLPARGQSTAEISFGNQPTEGVDIKINYQPPARWQGLASIDNHGNRFTGNERALGQLYWNDPSSSGDQLGLTVLSTGDKLNYIQLGYRRPVSLRTTIGVSVSALQYKLCCQNVGAQAKGSATSASLDVAHNLRMQRGDKLFLTASLDTRALKSELNNLNQTDRHVSGLGIGIRRATEASQGVLRGWALNLRAGQAELDNSTDRATDALAVRVQGKFSKLSGSFYQSNALGGGWSVLSQVRGQANLGRNLDSSEKFVLGGPEGVRAYPSGEAVGDSGLLANIELRYAVASAKGLSLSGFIDGGAINRFTKNASLILGQQVNSYNLSGLGFGLRYESQQATLALSIAEPLSGNRGKDAAGNNNEGRRDGKTQAWLQALLRF